jgi:hypothetical protein
MFGLFKGILTFYGRIKADYFVQLGGKVIATNPSNYNILVKNAHYHAMTFS